MKKKDKKNLLKLDDDVKERLYRAQKAKKKEVKEVDSDELERFRKAALERLD